MPAAARAIPHNGTLRVIRVGLILLLTLASVARGQDFGDRRNLAPPPVEDLRGSNLPATAERGRFLAVPIPLSDPTLGSGLIGVAAYFYPQTSDQEESQPASVTSIGALYTKDDNRGFAIAHNGYWREDRWRFSGWLADFDVTLPIVSFDDSADLLKVDWGVVGEAMSAEFARRFGEHWFASVAGQYLDVEQRLSINLQSPGFELPDAFRTVGMAAALRLDTRDKPTNAYNGVHFEASASKQFFRDSNESYNSFSLAFRAYHSVMSSLVLAWEVAACLKTDAVPLWDACGIDLRGFAATDYLGEKSVHGQVEARWRFTRRWGLVGFAGAGQMRDSIVPRLEHRVVPSYGLGLRFMVETDNRINMRLDYGRSTDSRAIHLFVGEAF